jgi:hypothetical protein
MTPDSPIRRRASQPQALLPRRRSRDRTTAWRRALWRRERRSPSSGSSASVEHTEHPRVIGTRPRWGAGAARVAAGAARVTTDLAVQGFSTEGFPPGSSGGSSPEFPPGPTEGFPPGRRPFARPLAPAPALGRRAGRRARPWSRATRRRAVSAARREMEAAVPEVIDVLRATVAAGINPRRALQAAAAGAPPALEPILRQAIQTTELGSGAGQALAAAAAAERLTELALAGEALDLAESTGAPPGPVLAGVAVAAADRVRTRQARMAATAQARLSARVVAAMAPAFLGVLTLTAPSEAAFLVREPLGWATLAAALTFELVGVAWSAHIVRGPAP